MELHETGYDAAMHELLNAAPARLTNSFVVPGEAIVCGFTVYSSNAAAQYVQIFDHSGVPANGTVPAMVFAAGAHSPVGVYYGMPGRYCKGGFTICNSTTETTLTIGAADCFFDVQFTYPSR